MEVQHRSRRFAVGQAAIGRLALLFACATVLQAQVTPVQQRGRQLIDEAVQALGGESFLNMRTRVETGRLFSFYHERLSGLSGATLWIRYLDPPRKDAPLQMEERQSLGKAKGRNERSAIVFTPSDAFAITYRGAIPLTQDRLDRYRLSTFTNFFYIMRVRRNEPGLTFEDAGADIVDNVPVRKVDIIDASNSVVTVYLHTQTHLPVQQRFVHRDPVQKLPIVEITRFGKYRDVGHGIVWPLDVSRERDGEKIFQEFADMVEIDKKLDDSLFELPSGIEVLPRPAN